MHDQRSDQQVVTNVPVHTRKPKARSKRKKSLVRLLNSNSFLIATIAVIFMYVNHTAGMSSPTAQTISFPSMCSKDNTDIDFSPGATASSGLTVTYTSSNPSVATISGSNVHITGTGTTTITASQSGNSNYAAVASVAHSFTVVDRYLTFKIDDFSGYSSLLNSNGVATINGTALKVADMTGVQWGSSFNTRKVTLGTGRKFSTYFVFNISNLIGGGADGIVFVLQGATSSAGGGGEGMGYSGISGRSLGIEFDIYGNGAAKGDGAANGGALGNHIAIDTNCNVYNPAGFLETGVPELTGADRHAWIESDGDTIYVRIGTSNNRDAATLLKAALPNSNNIPADIYAGFTGATGGSGATFTVKKWYFDNDFHGCGLDPATVHTEAPTTVTLTPSGSGDTRTITANVKNSSGANVSGVPVTLSVPSGDGTLTSNSGITDASGNVSVTLTKITTQIVTVRATVAGGAFGEASIAFEPTIQASNVTFSNIATTSMTASWTRGNGTDGVAVFIAAASSGSAVPVDGTTYSANAAFTSGSQIGTSGWYCIYNGTGTTVNITGLTVATIYRVMVCEYNGTDAIINYNSSNGTSNPNGQSTSKVPTVTTQAASSVAGVIATGNGTITDIGIPDPTAHGFCWNTAGNPTTADAKVDNGAASTTGAFTGSITGLTAGTTYYVRAYATNNAGTGYGDQVNFTTGKLNPVITTWPSASAITYGQQLSSSTLSGAVTVTAGTFAFTTPVTAPNAGPANQSVTFTPGDTANYNSAVLDVSVTVNKGAPVITTWPAASTITYGQQLASSTLSGSVIVTGGTFAFTTPATAPNTGTSNQSVTFTPTDTANYITAEQNVSITVNKAVPSITTWPTASSIAYGQTLAASTLSGESVVTAGTFAFTTPSITPSTGTSNQSVTFTPTDTVNYTTVTQNVSMMVGKTVPVIITWPTASTITYGQQLSTSTLSGHVVVTEGTFAFTTPSTLPSAGTAGFPVSFTPVDTVNYGVIVQNVSVTVKKATPSITTWPKASGITYGQSLSSSVLSGHTVVTSGTFTFSSLTTAPAVGTASQTVVFIPADTANYAITEQDVSVTVDYPLDPVVSKPPVTDRNGKTANPPRFFWNRTEHATGYHLQIAPGAGFDPSVIDTIVTDTFFISSLLTFDTEYFWRVTAVNGVGEGPWTPVDTITTTPPKPTVAPTVSNPPETDPKGETKNPPKFTWNKIPGTTGYHLQLSRDNGFNPSVIDTFVSDTTFLCDTLGHGTKYYWRIAAVNTDGQGPFTPVDSIRTVIQPPTVSPVITSKFPDTVKVGSSVQLSWEAIDSIHNYRIQISTDSAFGQSFIDTVITDLKAFLAQNLSADTRWFFRIAAVNNGGNGPWSTANSFTTSPADTGSQQFVSVVVVDSQATPLPQVTVRTDGDTTLKNLVITVAEKSDSITDTATAQVSWIYDFTRSPVIELHDTIFITLAIPDTFIDGTKITPKELPDIRVFRVDTTGNLKIIPDAAVDTSARTVTFRTDRLDRVTLAIDRLPPRIVDQTANQIKNSGSTPVISGQILDNLDNCQAYVYFRKGGDRGYDSLPVTINADGTFVSALNDRTLDLNGFEYFIGANDGTTRVTVEHRDIPVALSTIRDTAIFPVSQWYQFSAPLTLSDSRVSTLLKDMGKYGKDWKLFQRSLTSVADSFIEYGPDFTAVSTGYSYWLKTNKADLRIVADSGTTTPVSRCYEISIPARTWASIGVPYLFTIGWQSIIDSTGTDADSLIGPYTWQTNAWTPPIDITHLSPWQGYYVYNAKHSAVKIRIPSLRHSVSLAKTVATTGNKKLEWSISSKSGTDCRNYFGFHPGAHDGFNMGLDCPKPGSPQNDAPVTWFTRDDFNGISKRFQTDFTTAANGGASWSIVAGSLNTSESYSCKIDGTDNLGDSIQCILVDSRKGVVHDMKTGSYPFTPFENETERPFQILSGTSDYVAMNLKNTRLAPKAFMLNHIYPNPVRNTAIIRYALPWSANGMKVKLDIIDLQGRMVTTLVNNVQHDGYYTVQWNLHSGKSVISSGLYILRLSAGKLQKNTHLQVIR